MNMTEERTSKTNFTIGDKYIHKPSGLLCVLKSIHPLGLLAQALFNDEPDSSCVYLNELELAPLSDLQKLRVKLEDLTSVMPEIGIPGVEAYNAYLHVISMIDELQIAQDT